MTGDAESAPKDLGSTVADAIDHAAAEVKRLARAFLEEVD